MSDCRRKKTKVSDNIDLYASDLDFCVNLIDYKIIKSEEDINIDFIENYYKELKIQHIIPVVNLDQNSRKIIEFYKTAEWKYLTILGFVLNITGDIYETIDIDDFHDLIGDDIKYIKYIIIDPTIKATHDLLYELQDHNIKCILSNNNIFSNSEDTKEILENKISCFVDTLENYSFHHRDYGFLYLFFEHDDLDFPCFITGQENHYSKESIIIYKKILGKKLRWHSYGLFNKNKSFYSDAIDKKFVLDEMIQNSLQKKLLIESEI